MTDAAVLDQTTGALSSGDPDTTHVNVLNVDEGYDGGDGSETSSEMSDDHEDHEERDKKDEQLPGTSTSGADSHSIVVDLLEPQDDVEIECKDGAQEATTVVEETKHGSSPVVSSPVAAAVSPWAFRANSLENSAKESTEEPTDQARPLPQMGRGGDRLTRKKTQREVEGDMALSLLARLSSALSSRSQQAPHAEGGSRRMPVVGNADAPSVEVGGQAAAGVGGQAGGRGRQVVGSARRHMRNTSSFLQNTGRSSRSNRGLVGRGLVGRRGGLGQIKESDPGGADLGGAVQTYPPWQSTRGLVGLGQIKEGLGDETTQRRGSPRGRRGSRAPKRRGGMTPDAKGLQRLATAPRQKTRRCGHTARLRLFRFFAHKVGATAYDPTRSTIVAVVCCCACCCCALLLRTAAACCCDGLRGCCVLLYVLYCGVCYGCALCRKIFLHLHVVAAVRESLHLG